MADRRMISTKVIDTDSFIDMPATARLLYYDLNVRADDDGFIDSPKKITKMIGASMDDLLTLVSNQFIIQFESGVYAIRHWHVHNSIKADRYQPTRHLVEKAQLSLDVNKVYELGESNSDTEWNQLGAETEPQVRLGKIRLDKVRESTCFEKFWNAYPRKVGKGAAEQSFKKYRPDDELLKTILAAIENQKRLEQWQKDNGKYIPNPATWLNQKRWEDECQIHVLQPRTVTFDIAEYEASSVFDNMDIPR